MTSSSKTTGLYCLLAICVAGNVVCGVGWLYARNQMTSIRQERLSLAADIAGVREQLNDCRRTAENIMSAMESRIADLERKCAKQDSHQPAPVNDLADFVQTDAIDVPANPLAPAPAWREILFKDDLPLRNVPVIVATVESDGGLIVTVANTGTTVLEYSAGGKHHIQLFQETHENNEWKPGCWDWCGTGKTLCEIAPGQEVELNVRFWEPEKRERMVAAFGEKFEFRRGLVVLGTEPSPVDGDGITKTRNKDNTK